MGALALTEHGNVSSHVQLEIAALKTGVKPIFGCELYCGEVGENATQRKNHLTVLAATQEGYSNLLRVVSQGWSDFYYEPTVSGGVLSKHKQGLVILSGCTGSLLATSLVGGKNVPVEEASYARGRDVARRFKRTFGDAYYLEVQGFPELPQVVQINKHMARLSRELGIPLVATGDCHYTLPTENEMQQILHNVRAGNRQTLEDQARAWGYHVGLSPPVSDKAMLAKLIATGLTRREAINAILNTEEIRDRCNVTLPKLPQLRYPVPAGYESAQAVWRDWLWDGWRYRGCHALAPAERLRYRNRLQYEMDIIEQKDYIDYFLVVSDLVKFAKDTGIPVGPARGSAAASLVCYLLRITEVNPMLFPGLIFERFIDLTRQDLPDIDLDFDSERRGEIRSYLVSKYGSAQVSNIGTFTQYKAKNSLDDVARVYKIPIFEVEKVKDRLLERSSGDLRANATIEDTKAQFEEVQEVFDRFPDLAKSTLLEGNVKGMGVHAAGLVVSNGPITDVCAVYARDVKGEHLEVVSLDKKDALYQGLLKIDVLGLSTMTMLAECLRQLGMPLDDLYGISLEDEKVIDGFRANDVVGIFQFDGRAMRSVNAELQPDSFKEVCDVNALARPGPLHNNASAEYIDIKKGRKKLGEVHPLLAAITGDTHYQIVYQEQILRIVREIGGFDWTAAAYIRKIISQKIGEQEFSRQWDTFRLGAAERGVPEDVAKDIWGHCITAGAYAFCVTGDTVLQRPCGGSHAKKEVTVAELHEAWKSKSSWGQKLRRQGVNIIQMDADGRARPAKLLKIHEPIKVPVYTIVTKGKRHIKASLAHSFMTPDGYKTVAELSVGDELVVLGQREPTPYIKKGQTYHSGYKGKGLPFAEPNPAWIDGRTPALQAAKALVLDRSEGRCEHCSKDGSGKSHDLEFAHVLSLAELGGDYLKYHNINNVLHLCNSCHKKFDHAKGERKKVYTRGILTETDTIVSITKLKPQFVYDLTMESEGHNYIGNGFVNHNNNAHTVSYGMIAWWTMWFKQYHPEVFYVSSLMKMPDKRQLELLRDADRHKLRILPPHPRRSARSWTVEKGALRGGLMQVPGIGASVADKMMAFKAEHPKIRKWDDYLEIKGIGPKKIQNFEAFAAADDPFGVHRLERLLNSVRSINRQLRLPRQTHTSLQVPYSRGSDVEVVWYGVIQHRNLRELFEVNFSRTGEALDPDTVKDPHLNEWVIMVGADEEELLTLTIDRWKYRTFKKAIWGIKLDHDVVVIRGIKRGFQSRRAVYVKQMWVIDPEDDPEEDSFVEDIQF